MKKTFILLMLMAVCGLTAFARGAYWKDVMSDDGGLKIYHYTATGYNDAVWTDDGILTIRPNYSFTEEPEGNTRSAKLKYVGLSRWTKPWSTDIDPIFYEKDGRYFPEFTLIMRDRDGNDTEMFRGLYITITYWDEASGKKKTYTLSLKGFINVWSRYLGGS